MDLRAFVVVSVAFAVPIAVIASAPVLAQDGTEPAPESASGPAPVTPAPIIPAPAPPQSEAPPAVAPARAVAPAPAPAPAAASEGEGRAKVIVLDLKGASLSPAELSALGSLVTVSLSEYAALEVVSGADVREMLALEGQKAELGCEESMSCLAEIAGALGARLVAYGGVERLGSLLLLTLNLQDTQAGRSVGRIALQGESIEALAKAVPDAVKKMIQPFLEREKLSTTSASARAEAPSFVGAAAVKPASDQSGLAWAGGIIGGIGAVVFAATFGAPLLIAPGAGAPQDVIDAMEIPVAGKAIVAGSVTGGDDGSGSGGGGDGDRALQTTLYAVAGVEGIAAVAAVGGGIAFASAYMMDGPTLDGAGNAWRWGLLLGGASLIGGGIAFDAFAETSNNHVIDGADFVAPGMMLGGVLAGTVGLFTNPFVSSESGPQVRTRAEAE